MKLVIRVLRWIVTVIAAAILCFLVAWIWLVDKVWEDDGRGPR